MKVKILIALLIAAMFAIPAVSSANVGTNDDKIELIDAYVDSSYYVNSDNGMVYLTDDNIVLKLHFYSNLGASAAKYVQFSDPNLMTFIIVKELDANGDITIPLMDLLDQNGDGKPDNPRAFYEDFRCVQYRGLEKPGIAVEGSAGNHFIIEGSNPEIDIGMLNVDSTAPTMDTWKVKQNFLGRKTTLMVTADDTPGDFSAQQSVSGLNYVKIFIPGFSVDLKIVNFTIFDSREDEAQGLHPGSKAWVGEFDLHDNVLHAILCNGFVVECQDYAGHPPNQNLVEVDEDDIEKEKARFSPLVTLMQTLFERFPLLERIF